MEIFSSHHAKSAAFSWTGELLPFLPNGARSFILSMLLLTLKPSDEPNGLKKTIAAFDESKQLWPIPHFSFALFQVCPQVSLDVAVGGVIKQYINDQQCPLSFYSKTLQLAETWNSTHDVNC